METKLLDNLRGDKKNRDDAIRSIALNQEIKLAISSYVMRNSGSEDDASIIFTDTIVAFSKKVLMDRTFVLETKLKAYMLGIAKFIWIDELNVRKKQPSNFSINDFDISDSTENQYDKIVKGERGEMLSNILSQMKVNCKEVIKYWAAKYNMVEIANLLGYKNEAVARKKKSECMKELIGYLNANPEIKKVLRYG